MTPPARCSACSIARKRRWARDCSGNGCSRRSPSVAAIDARLDAVDALVRDPIARAALRTALDGVRDVERLAAKTAALRANPRDVRALGDSLARLPQVEAALHTNARAPACSRQIAASRGTRAPISRRRSSGPWWSGRRLSIGESETIAAGVDASARRTARRSRRAARTRSRALQAAERERTGIGSLKVGYNKVFGYFIEVTNANRHLVPDDYQRRQTLTGAERYVTPALKEFEEKVLHATERIELLERQLFDALRARVGRADRAGCRVSPARSPRLDVLGTLGGSREPAKDTCGRRSAEGFDLEITAGRHPVVERMMPRDQFIPNDVRLAADARMIILTGPNMAGKSTILRQIGLIVLMAQMGSFVPAARARVGIADRVFTRVGASDNLVRGQSTFMVEMSETSAILHTATARSLVLLDEIGRGTSTWDGVSIAWAVSEHLHERIGCKTVFATHYHELTQLADEFASVRNYNVDVRESGDRILFLHRLKPGGADRSYGIEVGRLAGLPQPVIARARALLKLLEGEQIVAALSGTAGIAARAPRGTGDQLDCSRATRRIRWSSGCARST